MCLEKLLKLVLNGLENTKMSKSRWEVGDLWMTNYGQIMEVTEVRGDGIALIKMIFPIKTRAHTQKPIPEDWKLLDKKSKIG